MPMPKSVPEAPGCHRGDPTQREGDNYVSSGRASPRLACSQMTAWPMRFSRVWIWPSISWAHHFGLGSCRLSFSPQQRCSDNIRVARTDPAAGDRGTTPTRCQVCFVGNIHAVKTPQAQTRLHAQSILQGLLYQPSMNLPLSWEKSKGPGQQTVCSRATEIVSG